MRSTTSGIDMYLPVTTCSESHNPPGKAGYKKVMQLVLCKWDSLYVILESGFIKVLKVLRSSCRLQSINSFARAHYDHAGKDFNVMILDFFLF